MLGAEDHGAKGKCILTNRKCRADGTIWCIFLDDGNWNDIGMDAFAPSPPSGRWKCTGCNQTVSNKAFILISREALKIEQDKIDGFDGPEYD